MTGYFVEPHPVLSAALLSRAVPFVCIMNFFHLQPSSVDQFNLDLEEGLARYSVPDTDKKIKTIFLSEWDHQRIFDGGAECGVLLKNMKTTLQRSDGETVKPSSDRVF